MHTRPNDIATADTTTVLQAARARDEMACKELVHRYDRAVRAAAAAYQLTSADAADVAQNTWLRLVEHAALTRHPEKLGGWLVTTTASRPSVASGRSAPSPRPKSTRHAHNPNRKRR